MLDVEFDFYKEAKGGDPQGGVVLHFSSYSFFLKLIHRF